VPGARVIFCLQGKTSRTKNEKTKKNGGENRKGITTGGSKIGHQNGSKGSEGEPRVTIVSFTTRIEDIVPALRKKRCYIHGGIGT